MRSITHADLMKQKQVHDIHGLSQSEIPKSTTPHPPPPPPTLVIMDQHKGQRNTPQKKLKAIVIDFIQDVNRVSHKTHMYDLQYPVLRRGQPFDIKVQFDAAYNSQIHDICFIFTNGSQARASKGTSIRIRLNDVSVLTNWKATRIEDEDSGAESELNARILTPPDALIGAYQVYVETKIEGYEPGLYRYSGDAFLVFNPFNSEDTCYMANEEEVNEYVMNEDGVIYLGSDLNVIAKKWHFGQFERYCLETALWLLEKANLPYDELYNPAVVCRTLAAMINGIDRGMIEAYNGATTDVLPEHWPGSISIVKLFLEQKGKPVKYGDCWTFSALYCTLCRSLGIPCRVVTCYKAAHDTNGNGSVDIHWLKNQQLLKAINTDSVWVAHTWNEVWFIRLDIEDDLQGWQAVDCTQNTGSESLYRLGPCPVKAISTGRVNTLYDAPFMTATTNGYQVHWLVDVNSSMTPINMTEDALGTKILTKNIASDDYIDLRNEYKLPGNVMTISKTLRQRKEKLKELVDAKRVQEDVKIEVFPPDEVNVGDSIAFLARLENKTDKVRTVIFNLQSFFENYKGILVLSCKNIIGEQMTLQPNSSSKYNMKIRAEDYRLNHIITFFLKAFIKITILETGQTFAADYDLNFQPFNAIRMELPVSRVFVNKQFQVAVVINNPLRQPLRNGIIMIEAQGTTRIIKLARPIAPGERVIHRVGLALTRLGEYKIYMTLKTTDVSCFEATHGVTVLPPDENDLSSTTPAQPVVVQTQASSSVSSMYGDADIQSSSQRIYHERAATITSPAALKQPGQAR